MYFQWMWLLNLCLYVATVVQNYRNMCTKVVHGNFDDKRRYDDDDDDDDDDDVSAPPLADASRKLVCSWQCWTVGRRLNSTALHSVA